VQRQLVRPATQATRTRAGAATDAWDDAHAFVFASCQFPSGMVDGEQSLRSQAALARRFADKLPDRVLLLGDQVYTDATYGLLDPVRLDDRYRLPYEKLGAPDGPLGRLPQDFRQVMRMTPDDHEIGDNWEPWQSHAKGRRYERGVDAYWRYQRGEHGAAGQDIWIKESAPQGWHLFMADTRTQRDYRAEHTIDKALMLGQKQTCELEEWLDAAPRQDLKIVTSPAMLLPRSLLFKEEPMRLDNWQGYPASFHRLLAFLCDREIPNVVFLSGDLHLGCRARVTVRNRGTRRGVAFQSHHAPALYAPYPFANETRWNLLLRDRFRFEWETDGRKSVYECRVSASTLAEGRNGCGVLQARRDGAGWKLRTTFVQAEA
jgi:cholesterol oxidase